MALVVEQQQAGVVDAVVEAFRSHGEPARRTTLGKLAPRAGAAVAAVPCVVVAPLRRVEIIATEPDATELLLPATRALDASKWEVVVLVPLADLGAAHGGLRGAPVRLQGWWEHRGDGAVEICFGREEIP